MTETTVRTSRLTLLGFLGVLVLAWFCYRPALSGAFQLDDIPNLRGLAQVEDVRTASDFVLAGARGPTGRPLALLTFALQADQFESGPGAFLRVNVMIHLINAVLLAWCLYQLTLLMAVERDRALLVATSAAGLWLLLPVLATSSLLVVQRMTTLSALFSLLGLGGYLAIRRSIGQTPHKSLGAMTMVLAVSTLLAACAKESGFLLPVLVLVIEATVLPQPDSIEQRDWRVWKLAVLVLPSVAVFAYLASHLFYPDWMQARRDFDGWERALTEAQILWVYVQNAVIGLPGKLGIYQTEYPISRSLFEFKTFIAVSAWLALMIAAIVWRRRRPLFAFAVLWYLAGHVIESTTLSLELYFEHRNYLPMIGPVYALCAYLLLRSGQALRFGVATFSLLFFLNAYLLYDFASIWGKPSVASRYWALKYPESSRAATNLATYQLVEEGPQSALRTIRQYTAAHPEFAYIGIQELNISCLFGLESDREQIMAELDRGLPGVVFTYSAGTMLSQLFTTTTKTDCGQITPSTVERLAIRLLQNARYINDPLYNQFHHKLLAGIARFQGDQAATLENLEKAISYRPSSELNMMMVTTLAGAGDFLGADNYINNAMLKKPMNPLKALAWQRDLDGLRAYTRELEEYMLRDQADEAAQGLETDEE